MHQRPCEGVCSFQANQCIGCKMFVSEIRNWFDMPEEAQVQLMEELATR